MKTIIVVEHLQATDTLLTVKREKVHGGKVHAHEARDELCFVGAKIMTMLGRTGTEAGTKQVEIVTMGVVVHIGIDS